MRYHTTRAINRAVVETLEERKLLSAMDLIGDILLIEGTQGLIDDIILELHHNRRLVRATVNGDSRMFNLRRIESIQIVADPQHDRINVSPELGVPVTVTPPPPPSSGGENGGNTPPAPQDPQDPPAPSQPQEPAPTQPTEPVDPPSNPQPPTNPVDPPEMVAGAPNAVITITGGAGLVGQAVHVHALESVVHNGTQLTARYEWDFGSSGSYSQLTGFNAAHVYDEPGVYTITLRVTDKAGASSAVTAEVDIAADTRRTIYVAASGSGSNSGLSAAQPVTLDRAMQMMGDDTRLLLRRGDTFNVADTLDFPYSNVLIGAYGSGSRPVLYSVTNSTSEIGIITLHSSSSGITIENITFDSKYTPVGDRADKIPPMAIWADGTGITIRDNRFLNVVHGVMASSRPQQLMVLNNSAPLDTGIRGYFIWAEGRDHVYVGNSAANSTREHIIRAGVTGVERALIAHNDLTNIGRTSVDKSDIVKSTIAMQVAKHVYIADNSLRGPVSIGPVKYDIPQWNRRAEWVVVQQNTIRGELQVLNGSHHVMVRENTIVQNGGWGLYVRASDVEHPHRTLENINIISNLVTNSHENGTFLALHGRAEGTIRLMNNEYHAPNLVPLKWDTSNALMYIQDKDLRSFTHISGNVWPDVNGIAWAQGGLFYVGTQVGVQASCRTPEWWLSQPQVDGDIFL